MTEKLNKKAYVKPTIEVIELRPEERIAVPGSNCGWRTPGGGDSNCTKGPSGV